MSFFATKLYVHGVAKRRQRSSWVQSKHGITCRDSPKTLVYGNELGD